MNNGLVYPYGSPLTNGLLKEKPEDFIVDEVLGFEPSGEGEHLLLRIEKINLTTFELIERVASDFNIKQRDVGYSGLKDKQAITRQWLSLHLPGQMRDFGMPSVQGYEVLDQGWHNRKLKPGTHKANEFKVVIREVDSFDVQSWAQIESINERGMANYFGQQRFGEQVDNVSRALKVFTNSRKTRKLSRNKKSLYISALRSYLFNLILGHRIEHGYWSEPVSGDVFMLAGTRSVFSASIDDQILARYRDFDISSTASLVGLGEHQFSDVAEAIENSIYSNHTEIIDCLWRLKAKHQKRSIRVKVEDFNVQHDPEIQTLTIQARLPRGSYFTALLNHFINTSVDS